METEAQVNPSSNGPWLLLIVAAIAGVALFGGGSCNPIAPPGGGNPPPAPIQPYNPGPAPQPLPGPWNPQPQPRPCPGPGPCPRPGPWGDLVRGPVGSQGCGCCEEGDCKAHPGQDCGCGGGPCCCGESCRCAVSVGASVSGRDDSLQCDLPLDLHQKNTGGSDGAGLCVFASLKHTGLWQNDPVFAGLFDWMRHHPGGGYPQKVDKMIRQFCQEKSLPLPSYIQVEGLDIELLKLACRTGRMPGITYNHSPSGRYGGQRISHMVSLAACTDDYALVLDNNFPGSYERLDMREFKSVDPSWAVVNLNPPPPAPPFNH